MRSLRLIIALSLVLCFTAISYSQPDDAFGFEENVDDVPAAPIKMLLYIGLIAGSYLGIKKLKRK